MTRTGWELLFMMLVLKLPIIYLCAVVWYAIKAEPDAGEEQEAPSIWRPWQRPDGPRPRRGAPHGTRDSGRGSRARRGRVAA